MTLLAREGEKERTQSCSKCRVFPSSLPFPLLFSSPGSEKINTNQYTIICREVTKDQYTIISRQVIKAVTMFVPSEQDATIGGFWFAVAAFVITLPGSIPSTYQGIVWFWAFCRYCSTAEVAAFPLCAIANTLLSYTERSSATEIGQSRSCAGWRMSWRS
jgi:hypothetical protein